MKICMGKVNSAFVVLGMALTLAGCGTEGGNPNLAGPAGMDSIYATKSQTLLNAICLKLTTCFGSLSGTSCFSGVRATSNIDTEIGLAGGFGTFESVLNAEYAGTITPDATAADQCISDIQALGCSDPAVTGAYSAASPNDFTNVVTMLPVVAGSCPDFF